MDSRGSIWKKRCSGKIYDIPMKTSIIKCSVRDTLSRFLESWCNCTPYYMFFAWNLLEIFKTIILQTNYKWKLLSKLDTNPHYSLNSSMISSISFADCQRHAKLGKCLCYCNFVLGPYNGLFWPDINFLKRLQTLYFYDHN